MRTRIAHMLLRWGVRLLPRAVNTLSWPEGSKWADLRTVENGSR